MFPNSWKIYCLITYNFIIPFCWYTNNSHKDSNNVGGISWMRKQEHMNFTRLAAMSVISGALSVTSQDTQWSFTSTHSIISIFLNNQDAYIEEVIHKIFNRPPFLFWLQAMSRPIKTLRWPPFSKKIMMLIEELHRICFWVHGSYIAWLPINSWEFKILLPPSLLLSCSAEC